MESKIREIIKQIEALNEKLVVEYKRLAKEHGYAIQKRKVRFLEKVKAYHEEVKIPLWKYILPTNFRHLLSLPFIYSVAIPVVILDIFITIYHAVAFPLYRIPKVKRGDYIVYDRRFLSYLNVVQKMHCLYCSYVNGFLGYAVEIAARTERYWCPVKAAQKPKYRHGWYKDFADYGDPAEWNERFNQVESFIKNEKDVS